MKNRKAIWLPVSIVLLLSFFLVAYSEKQFERDPIETTSPTYTEATYSSNKENTLQTTAPKESKKTTLSTEETTAPTIDETTAPTINETTAPSEAETHPTKLEEAKTHEHDYSVMTTVKPGCLEDGYATYECACGDTYTEATEARGYHAWGEWKVTQETTATSEGERARKCVDCGTAQCESIAMLPAEEMQPPTEPPVTEPPATEPPVTEPTEPPTTEPPHVHSYTEKVVAPTCDEGGCTTHICDCGNSYTDSETPSLGHSYLKTVVEPTVSSEGYTEHTCSRCGDSFQDSYVSKLDPPDVTLDYAAAMAYGNQYAADTYGWYIDLSLNFDNAGFNFPTAGSKQGVIKRGGQEDLYRMVRKEIDGLRESLLSRGITGIPYINCYVYEDSSELVVVYVFYG